MIGDAMEIWKKIDGYDGYLISSLGRVWSEKTKRIRKPGIGPKGYMLMCLCSRNKPRTFRLNRLVLQCFVGPAPTELHHAAHKNGDKADNSVENLYWATPEENVADRLRHGTYARGEDHPMAKVKRGDVVYARWRRSLGDTWAEIGSDIGVTADVISRHVRSSG